MCGIFGFISNDTSGLKPNQLKHCIDDLAVLSESRGKEAAGVAVATQDAIHVHKRPVAASLMIASRDYRQFFARIFNLPGGIKPGHLLDRPLSVIGHSRLVTDGAQERHENNQPVISNGIVAVHNGIVTNGDTLWHEFPSLKRAFAIDTEIVLSLTRHLCRQKGSLVEAAKNVYKLLEGVVSMAMLFDDLDYLLLATNNGSLYMCSDEKKGIHVFASERYILERWQSRRAGEKIMRDAVIQHIKAGTGVLVNIQDLCLYPFSLSEEMDPVDISFPDTARRKIFDIPSSAKPLPSLGLGRLGGAPSIPKGVLKRAERTAAAVAALRRCRRCILPQTMPHIRFDQNGVCNYCHAYRPVECLGREALEHEIEKHRRSKDEPDCILAFSGGRDSSYGLHYAVKELGLKPLAYTYDWGMVTDLARRNISRMCGKLGIEHVLVSADINKKRKNIQRNINAWLKKPELGMVPILMAGDKQYLYYANKIKEQTGIKLVMFCYNPLERTEFKTGFTGVAEHGGQYYYDISFLKKFRVGAYYLKQVVKNKGYINPSLGDSLHAFYVTYFANRKFTRLYEYIRWNEEQILSTLNAEYNWEAARDTSTTWRIGDGTAAFYNHIYYTAAGFSEIDTFLSNQIREGKITREVALQRARTENLPRWDSIKWYCDIVGIPFLDVVKAVDGMPRRFDV